MNVKNRRINIGVDFQGALPKAICTMFRLPNQCGGPYNEPQ